jgi:hypothetical protein
MWEHYRMQCCNCRRTHMSVHVRGQRVLECPYCGVIGRHIVDPRFNMR